MADALAWSVACLVAVAALTVYRAQRRRQVERAFDERFGGRRTADGVIAGAERFELPGTDGRAIVLIHGFNDSPQTMRPVATALQAAGWFVYAPLLPGHGRSLRAFAASQADEWLSAARAEVRAALGRHAVVAVGGLSLGGAIATILASEEPRIVAAVLFAPFLVHSRRLGAIAALGPVLQLFFVYLTGGSGAQSVRDPVARDALISYRCSTPRLLREVQRVVRRARAALPQLRQPVWIAQSSDDYRISIPQAQRAFDLLGSVDKHLHWTTGNGHVITMDYGHEQLAAEAVRWLAQRVPAV